MICNSYKELHNRFSAHGMINNIDSILFDRTKMIANQHEKRKRKSGKTHNKFPVKRC